MLAYHVHPTIPMEDALETSVVLNDEVRLAWLDGSPTMTGGRTTWICQPSGHKDTNAGCVLRCVDWDPNLHLLLGHVL